MIFILGFVGLILAMCLWIIFVPLFIDINSQREQYCIYQPGTFSIHLYPARKAPWSIKVLGFMIKPANKVRQQEPTPNKRKTSARKSPHAWRYLATGVANSIHIRRVILDVDLNDVVLHAQMIPVLQLVNNQNVMLHTNLANRLLVDISVVVRLYRLLWTFILFSIKK